MSVVNTRAFPCVSCNKLISYDPHQADKEIACPRCGHSQRVPASKSLPPPLPGGAKKKRRSLSCLLFGGCGCLSVLALLALILVLGTFVTLPVTVRQACQGLSKPLVSRGYLPGTAPESVTFAGSGISVSVSKIAKGCPTIYQAALKRTSATETPAYCVTVTIGNDGEAPVAYRTWRTLEDANDVQRAAQLEDSEGNRLGLISFGVRTWPEGAIQRADLAPGESASDILLFECGTVSEGGLMLTLPGENVGQFRALRVRIPRDMVHPQLSHLGQP